MGFWETLWASMWGALGGAVVASVASWAFALDLRRRDRRDRDAERAQIRTDRELERRLNAADRERERRAAAQFQVRLHSRSIIRPALREISAKLTDLAVEDSAHEARALALRIGELASEASDEAEGEEHDLLAALSRFAQWPTFTADAMNAFVTVDMYLSGKSSASEAAAAVKAHTLSDVEIISEMRVITEGGSSERAFAWPIAKEDRSAIAE